MSILYICVGAPASGKTTWSQQFCQEHPEFVYISSDGLRGTIGLSESDQSVSREVFLTMFIMERYFLRNGKSAIIDATNVRESNRREFIQIAVEEEAEIRFRIFKAKLETLKERNLKRDKVVPEDVIEKMYKNFTMPRKEEMNGYENWRLEIVGECTC